VGEIWRVIGTIRADGRAALIVDRDHRRVAAHADRLLVLAKGRVVRQGPAAARLEGGEPRSTWACEALVCVPVDSAAVR
jgi:branched-chain amino acid transport system ATP-binding protein